KKEDPDGFRLAPLSEDAATRQSQATDLLRDLVDAWYTGLTHPLPFEPNAGFNWASRGQADTPEEQAALDKAKREEAATRWEQAYAGLRNRHVSRIFGRHGPFELEPTGVALPPEYGFEALADRVVGPLLRALLPAESAEEVAA
ncbi:MAG: hypothetical protein ACI9WU_005112, partial [Myxococcota bacterium]